MAKFDAFDAMFAVFILVQLATACFLIWNRPLFESETTKYTKEASDSYSIERRVWYLETRVDEMERMVTK